jgi:6-phosphofructokinase
MTMRIAVNTGGGDAPGLNAVVLSARRRGWDVFGIEYGYRGLIEDDPAGIVPLDRDAVRGINQSGRPFSIVVVAEGARPIGGGMLSARAG